MKKKEISASDIISDIKGGNVKPLYFLCGEEPYFIDQITETIESEILTEDEKSFNQSILYGRDVSIGDIVGAAKRFPMMAEYQIVIVKEAQSLSKTMEQLLNYAKDPQKSTVLVICYKNKKLDKRKALAKAFMKNGVYYYAKRVYDNQIASWIQNHLRNKGYQIEPKAAKLMEEFLGADLGRIDNELNKLIMLLSGEKTITSDHIERNIGISKDFNNFELQKALAQKKPEKAFRIIDYFSQNPKDNPIFKTVPILYSFFNKLLIYHSLKDKSKQNAAAAMSVSPYFLDDYRVAASNLKMKKVSRIVQVLREADVKSKGVGVSSAKQPDLLKELLYKIID